MNKPKERLTLLLLAKPDWQVNLYGYDDEWQMYRYEEPVKTEVERALLDAIRNAPFATLPEKRAKQHQQICERLRDVVYTRDKNSEQELRGVNYYLRLAGIHHPYVLPKPIAVQHLGVAYVELHGGIRAYPVGEIAPRTEEAGSTKSRALS